MLHCWKEKKSDGSKYNVLLFSFVSHLQETVVFSYKVKLRWNVLNIGKYFLVSESKNDVEVLGVNFAE